MQPWKLVARLSKDSRRTVSVLNIGCMYNRGDDQPLGVGQDMAFASFDFLARVKA